MTFGPRAMKWSIKGRGRKRGKLWEEVWGKIKTKDIKSKQRKSHNSAASELGQGSEWMWMNGVTPTRVAFLCDVGFLLPHNI